MRKVGVTFFPVLAIVLLAFFFVGLTQAQAAVQTVKVKGELIDTYCYSLMGAHGASHRDCAIECVKKGIPAGLLEEGSNKVYVLLPNKDKTGLPQTVIEKMAQTVTVTGKVYTVGGNQFLTIESIQ